MMTTGWPAISLAATCGSEPVTLWPPFGGRHGTREKMSEADFATSLTLSMARAAALFCAGLACSAALAPVVGASGVLVPSCLAVSFPLSDKAARWPTCACAQGTDTGVSSIAAATADASVALRQKGKRKLINSSPNSNFQSLILLRLIQTGRIDHELRQRAAEAAMNTLGQI